uniref:CKLF-like MARVEL transmembrane domain-containing protein 4 n=1 Tax=Hirondellea gigas TaxID=1518452 RepID=A0A2P2I6N7_9CRUS
MMEPGTIDPGFPEAHTSTKMTPQLRFDPSYIRTVPGILKIVQMIINIIGYIIVSSSVYSGYARGEWFAFVSMTGFWLTGVLLVLYLMHIIEKFGKVPWMLVEFVYTALWTFFYFTCSMAVAVWGGYSAAFAACAFFGFADMLVYGADAFFKFRGWRGDEVAQGIPHVQMPPPEVQSPGAY